MKKDRDQLILLAAASRNILTAEISALKHKLDVPARVRTSLQKNPIGWLTGSLASGIFTSMLFRKKRPRAEAPVKRRGWILTLLGLSFSALQPLARIWLTNQAKQYLSGQRLSLNPRTPQR